MRPYRTQKKQFEVALYTQKGKFSFIILPIGYQSHHNNNQFNTFNCIVRNKRTKLLGKKEQEEKLR